MQKKGRLRHRFTKSTLHLSDLDTPRTQFSKVSAERTLTVLYQAALSVSVQWLTQSIRYASARARCQ
jgi:hypothetical protein